MPFLQMWDKSSHRIFNLLNLELMETILAAVSRSAAKKKRKKVVQSGVAAKTKENLLYIYVYLKR